jgi:hypothetical protein
MDYTWKKWEADAAKESGGPTLAPAEGYVAEVVDAGAKPTKTGKTSLWFRLKILVGPSAGATETLYQQLDPENPKALAAFYGVLGRLGVDFSKVPDGTPPEALAKSVIGRKFKFNFSHRTDPKTQRVYANFSNLEQLDVTPNAAPPKVVAPVEATTEVVAPADSIEAQIAALQAQQAVAAVPAKGKLPF